MDKADFRKQIYKIDVDGYIDEVFLGTFVNDILVEPRGEFISDDLPQPLLFYRPKWNGLKWVEGATQEEIDEIAKVEPLPPSAEERINSLEEALLLMMLEG